ncbi:unnamed protein product [Adineta ricciae]|uniref:Uncharacterized protein n=1 Tax=Adineta ricciae TaxID=249248 RepID=A0A816F574_ADIRI|nr:unnamed protein product [Adineta ricciae]CAF1658671.1 unnamed protein product [Adineta ricciae]
MSRFEVCCQSGLCHGGSGSGGGDSNTYRGERTHFDVAVGYTACGTLRSRFDMVAALNAPQFHSHIPNVNPNTCSSTIWKC